MNKFYINILLIGLAISLLLACQPNQDKKKESQPTKSGTSFKPHPQLLKFHYGPTKEFFHLGNLPTPKHYQKHFEQQQIQDTLYIKALLSSNNCSNADLVGDIQIKGDTLYLISKYVPEDSAVCTSDGGSFDIWRFWIYNPTKKKYIISDRFTVYPIKN